MQERYSGTFYNFAVQAVNFWIVVEKFYPNNVPASQIKVC